MANESGFFTVPVGIGCGVGWFPRHSPATPKIGVRIDDRPCFLGGKMV